MVLRWNSIFSSSQICNYKKSSFSQTLDTGLINDHKMNSFLFCAGKACVHMHTCTHILVFLSLTKSVSIIVIMLCAIYRANACPTVLACWAGPNSPECSGHVKGNAEAVCWKAGFWIQGRDYLADPQVCILRLWIHYKLGVTKLLIAITSWVT